MIKLIIFDWDDVFTIGSKEGYFKCYDETLNTLNVPRNPKEERRKIISTWGRSYKEAFARLLKNKPELINKAYKIFERHLFGKTFINSLSIVKGLQNFLIQLSSKYTLALSTGVHPITLKEKIMPKFKIPNVFTEILSIYDLEDPSQGKPNPYSLEEIIRRTRMNKHETIFVGDSENDVLTAKNAGVTPVVVLTGHLTEQEAKKLNVEYIIPDVTQLNEVLEKLNNSG